MNMLRKIQFDEVAGTERIYRSGNLRKMSLNLRPTCRRQYQNREASASQVLLVAQVLVGGDEDSEIRFRCAKKAAVFEFVPTHFVGRGNSVACQSVAQGRGRSLVEEDLHRCRRGMLLALRRSQALFGVVQNRVHLFAAHAWEPIEEIVHPRPILQILEQRLDRHPCALENPGATDLPWVPFDCRTLTPLKHRTKLYRQTRSGKFALLRLNDNDCSLLTVHFFDTSVFSVISCSNS